MKIPKKNVAVIIDHSNLKHSWQSTKHLYESKFIDFLKLIKELSKPGKTLYKVIFLNREITGDKQCSFFDQAGFETIEKKAKDIMENKKRIRLKCNMDVDISIIAMQMIFDRALYPIKPDEIVFVSGDSDFEVLGNTLIGYGTNVRFAFLRRGFARELRENFQCEALEKIPVWKNRNI